MKSNHCFHKEKRRKELIMSTEQVCQGGDTLIFACSGAADVGAISDLAARKLTREGVGKMFCLAGVGGRVAPIMEKTRSASRVLAMDGCGLDCVKKTLELTEIANVKHLRVTDLGLEKGKSPASDPNVDVVVTQARAMLQG
jgi:uncharacterized metal-binding protein